MQRVLRAGAVTVEYSQSPILGSDNVTAIASQVSAAIFFRFTTFMLVM